MATCKDCLHDEMCYATHTGDSPACCDFKDKRRFIELEPGRWIKWYPPMHMVMTGEEVLYRCDRCSANYSDVEGYRFCPRCGAFMEKEADNAEE